MKAIFRTCCLAVAALALGVGLVLPTQLQQVEEAPEQQGHAAILENLPLDAEKRATLEGALKARQYKQAEDLLVKEIDRDPKSCPLLTLLARVFFLDGKYLNCAIAMKKADAVSPLKDPERFTLALAYIILNHRDWARPELEKLAAADPASPLYPYWLGRIDYDGRQYRAAVVKFQKALEVNPDFMKAYDNLGLSYEGLGEYDNAINIYRKAVDLNRKKAAPSPWPPLNLGALLVKLGRFPEAEASLKESLQYAPRFPTAHYQMGLLLDRQGQELKALEELRQAAENDPSYPDPHYLMTQIYQRLGEKEQADSERATFQKLKKQYPREDPH